MRNDYELEWFTAGFCFLVALAALGVGGFLWLAWITR